ncbi:MAG TPA: TIGR03086 family metal-binding protein [Streptosporangiales bacterium]
MTTIHDLRPAARLLGELVSGVGDDQLGAPTPCPDYTLGDLIAHVNGLSLAFTWAATKDERIAAPSAPTADASRLGDDWRTRIPAQLATLGDAWQRRDAWEGMTRAGGVDLPGDVAGLVALNEIVVHGWDVARAAGRPYEPDAQSVELCMEFAEAFPADGGGAFGPRVSVPRQASPLDHLLGLTGRQPWWTAG